MSETELLRSEETDSVEALKIQISCNFAGHIHKLEHTSLRWRSEVVQRKAMNQRPLDSLKKKKTEEQVQKSDNSKWGPPIDKVTQVVRGNDNIRRQRRKEEEEEGETFHEKVL